MRERLTCDVVGCNGFTTLRSRLEEQYGLTLCDDDALPIAVRTAVALNLVEREISTHFLVLCAADRKGNAKEWIAENCTVEYACGHRARKSDDYICPACRADS